MEAFVVPSNCSHRLSHVSLEVYLEKSDLFIRSVADDMPLFEIEADLEKENDKAMRLINEIEMKTLDDQTFCEMFPGFHESTISTITCNITDARFGVISKKDIVLKRKLIDSDSEPNYFSSEDSSE